MKKLVIKHEDVLAHVAIKKSLLKEYRDSKNNRIVYLNDGDEFQIYIFNPYDYVIGVSFSFNSNNVNNSKLLVLKPGETVWLDRYLNESRKLLFNTYEVDNCDETKKAIAKNGLLTINFYKEEEKKYYYDIKTIPNSNIYWNNNYGSSVCSTVFHNNDCLFSASDITLASINASYTADSINTSCTTSSINTSCTSDSINTSCTSDSINTSCASDYIETGRIEKGNYSNQKFSNYYGDFYSWPFKTEQIKLLPMSQKQFNSNDLKKKYCPECGRKIKDKFKYCPYCGAKL